MHSLIDITIITCDIENLTAQMHGLYNCHEVIKNVVCVSHDYHVLFLVTLVLLNELWYAGITD